MTHPSHDPPSPDTPGLKRADDRFACLWTDYLEGELDPAGMAELNRLLTADERLVGRAADLYQTHRRLGLLAERGLAPAGENAAERFVSDVMARLPVSGERLTEAVMASLGAASPAANPSPQRQTARSASTLMLVGGGLLTAAVTVAAIAAFWERASVPGPAASAAADPIGTHRRPTPQATTTPARFASLARARFLDRATPPRATAVAAAETYVLSAGLVELAFPLGATAIIEGPAVFRVCGPDCLAVDVGRCSVHAPDAAAGFRVVTPASHVIDRGTRFVVDVDEASVTEVQVIEGAADLIVRADPAETVHRLTSGDVARHTPADATPTIGSVAGRITRTAYRPRLPDRLISYTASLQHPVSQADGDAAGPGIDTLESITVQRGGETRHYDVGDLIGVTLQHFRGSGNRNNLTLPGEDGFSVEKLRTAGARRGLLETDRLLTTGIINPGGGKTPRTAEQAAAEQPERTPGMAVSFQRPVVNQAGPEVILFELQVLPDPPEGDAFHVSPLRFKPRLRAHTVTGYDIDSTSPESQLMAPFRLVSCRGVPESLADLLEQPLAHANRLPLRARANAVAIDLADLGYAEGETCDGLFFQDAADDATTLDPVFIAGLPPLGGKATP